MRPGFVNALSFHLSEKYTQFAFGQRFVACRYVFGTRWSVDSLGGEHF
jgi:hypothetical protein